jgi:hypothetical protein
LPAIAFAVVGCDHRHRYGDILIAGNTCRAGQVSYGGESGRTDSA